MPASACVPDARTIDSVSVSANLFECRGHGFGGSEGVRLLRFDAANSTPSVIAGPTTWYQVAPTTDQDFFGLVGVVLTDTGAGTFVVVENIVPKIDDIMFGVTSYLVANATAYASPVDDGAGVGPDDGRLPGRPHRG